MLVVIRDSSTILPPGTIDIYPGIDNKSDAAFSARFTILNGEISYQGELWTPERMRLEMQKAQAIQDAFFVALAVVGAETVGRG